MLVLDLGLPDMGGVELVRPLVQRDLRILVFTMHREPIFATQALRAGALGYVTKSSPPEVLLHAVYRLPAVHQPRYGPPTSPWPCCAPSLIPGGPDPARV